MKLIVAATDFSPVASAAMRRAAQLAAASGSRLTLLHVARLRSAWEGLGDRWLRASLRCRPSRRRTSPGVLTGSARQRDGTAPTAPRAVPVLAVTREPRGPYRRILVATDLSTVSARGAQVALRMFPQASIGLVHVYRPLFDDKLSRGGVSKRARGEYRRRAAAQAMISLSAFAERTSLGRALLEVRLGSAVAVLRERAEQVHADLLVLAPSPKSWLERVIFLGTTGAMLSHADHDVLITPPARRSRPLWSPQSDVRNPKSEATAAYST